MRASLLHPLRAPGHSRRQRRAAPVAASESAVRGREPAAQRPRAAARPGDPAVQRVREAGGPVDQASYTCTCGYLFSASVSTSVMCPHCGADQAW
jgi:rubrerythrin